MSSFLKAARSVAAVIAGYLVIVLGTILTLEVWLGGIGLARSSATELALASFGTVLSGVAGGLTAAWLAGRRPLLHGIAVLIPVAIDTASILIEGKSVDPVWFDLSGSAMLVAGSILGGYLVQTSFRPFRRKTVVESV